MSSVHLGRLVGAAGFGRTVAIKQLHPHLAAEKEFVAMLLDEARLASRVQHPNVVSVSDVVQDEGQLLLIMEYVAGVSLAELLNLAIIERTPVPLSVVSAIGTGILHGLHAAHEATDEQGRALGIVHRDVSPQNILIGTDGVARLVDFGVAKAAGRLHTTAEGHVKGKMAYMSPEQLRSGAVDRRADVYAAAMVLWETVTLQRPFGGDDPPLRRLIEDVPPPSSVVPALPRALDALIMRGLTQEPARRIATAREMALELEAAVPPAPVREVAAFVNDLAADLIQKRAALLSRVERSALEPGDLDDRTPSGLSVTGVTAPYQEPAVAARRSGGGRRALVAFVLVAGAAVAAAFYISRQGLPRSLAFPGAPGAVESPTATAAAPPTPTPAPVPAPAEAPPPAAAEATPPIPPPAQIATPPAAKPQKARAGKAGRGARRSSETAAVSRARAKKKGGRAASPGVGCEPPFTIGPDGVKQYKLECL